MKVLVESVYLKMPSVAHVAINTRDVGRYFGAMDLNDVTVVPNTIDTNDPRISRKLPKDRAKTLRRQILGRGHEDDFVLVCPVRPVGRKRLDVAIDFVRRLQTVRPDLEVTMLVTHDEVDAPKDELSMLRSEAEKANVHLVFGHERLSKLNRGLPEQERFDTWDQYEISDAALYFSDFEGFGNVLLETLAFELPAVVNEYEIFARDIAPVGFDLMQVRIPPDFTFADLMEQGLDAFQDVALAGVLPDQLDEQVAKLAALLDRKGSPGEAGSPEDQDRVRRNRALIEQHYAYPVVERVLTELLERSVRAVAQPSRDEGVERIRGKRCEIALRRG